MSDDTKRYAEEMFPNSYASWRYFIEIKCGLALTPKFIQALIAVFCDPHNEESRRSASLYGEPWREQVLSWFQRVAAEA